ncbi:hypothetical protein KY290_011043 [Solanum tuberosum]|uniref:Polygalacturonase n=1 Tax=Solanum tuberosum TaxID=4113 RepID=A0ABQ7VZG7_SOLTU|nr:hypothetical protein KY290_011043 [Solanum tuberosum]
MQEAGVQNVAVKTSSFTGIENGVRVKTWSRHSNGFVRNVLFQHVVMNNLEKPIIIDQNYCPSNGNCPEQVQASSYKDHPAEASCVNVGGKASGLQQPTGCLQV